MDSSDNLRPKVVKTETEWRKQLTPEQYHVAREHGTERAFTGPYWNEKASGIYKCARRCSHPIPNSTQVLDGRASGHPSAIRQ
jgi:peptide-methionine (R)-S-oxide reductase